MKTNHGLRLGVSIQANGTSDMFFEILQETPSPRRQITKSQRNEIHPCIVCDSEKHQSD